MKFSHLNLPVTGMVLALAFAGTVGAASSEDVKVKLNGAEETPPVETSASGSGKISIAADHSVSGSVKTKKIDGTVAHIHVGAPGESGPPIVTLVKGEDGEWNVPAGAKFNAEQYTAFKEGKLYVNVHSADHKPGEIRGQLKP
ncbi:MAG TPA: CHRD domain-containing protein [Spongiibacteraceae bacterium]|jgi:hypothetical protein